MSKHKLAIHKKDRGVGFKIFIAFNITLIIKPGWRIIIDQESLIS